jgi:membrane protease YdiL (CAAX protease family)
MARYGQAFKDRAVARLLRRRVPRWRRFPVKNRRHTESTAVPRPPYYWRDPVLGVALLLPLPFWFWFHQQGGQPIAPWWLLVLVAPVLEELVFRRAIQGMALRYPVGRRSALGISLANILAASLFATLHFISHQSPAALLTFFPGVVFGFFRDRYGSVVPAIALHAYYNLGLLAPIDRLLALKPW